MSNCKYSLTFLILGVKVLPVNLTATRSKSADASDANEVGSSVWKWVERYVQLKRLLGRFMIGQRNPTARDVSPPKSMN